MFEIAIQTSEGPFLAGYSAAGLCELRFPPRAKNVDSPVPVSEPPTQFRAWHLTTVAALNEFLAGRPPRISPPLDLLCGTAFQQQVWQALRNIGWGETRSYADVAKAIGKSKAVRAVGRACGANPIPLFVPCHRVLAANRRLGGFSGGLEWKRLLLELEGIRLQAPQFAEKPNQQELSTSP